jgi:hypothetical protein
MKGILNKKEHGWFVSYRTDDMNIDSYDNLPLFPDTEISLVDMKQVEFDIIELPKWRDGAKYAKIIK